MVTTVTVSTIAIIAASSIAIAIGIFVSILLIGLLSGREILHTGSGSRQKLLARSLMVGIVPLVIGFIVIVVLKVTELLS
jgi:hypothetical protein